MVSPLYAGLIDIQPLNCKGGLWVPITGIEVYSPNREQVSCCVGTGCLLLVQDSQLGNVQIYDA